MDVSKVPAVEMQKQMIFQFQQVEVQFLHFHLLDL
jgi:hypothetical protein